MKFTAYTIDSTMRRMDVEVVHASEYEAIAARLAEAERDREGAIQTMLTMREQREKYADRLYISLGLLENNGIHIEEPWCWCEPKKDSENHWIHQSATDITTETVGTVEESK